MCEQVYCWYYELLESFVVTVELALQVYCNLVLKIIHCAGFGVLGFLPKGFPRVYHCVILYFSVCMVCGCNIIVKVVNESEIVRI